MIITELLAACDHTLLKPDCTSEQIKQLCDEAVEYRCASVCIPASYVKAASDYVNGRIPICTVIGFPNGYTTTAAKCFEADDAIKNGADEIDMVINIGWLKDGRDSDVLSEVRAVKKVCGSKVLKVIVETCLLTRDEKVRVCDIVSNSGADYIKTSTGFSTGGATAEDVELFAARKGPELKIKAAGGISTLAQAEILLKLGASRLGTSKIVKLVKDN